MPIYRDTVTNVITDLPENVGNHPVLGRNLVPYVADACEFEEDKVVVEAPVSTARIVRTATPTEKDKD